MFYPLLRLRSVSFPFYGINNIDGDSSVSSLRHLRVCTADSVSERKSRERQLATLLGNVIDLLRVHSLCESILAFVCLFLGVLFTALHSYLFCIASYVRLYFLHLDIGWTILDFLWWDGCY